MYALLSTNVLDILYWAFADLWDGTLGPTKQILNITLGSDSPEMLVYVLGKSGSDTAFDVRVPPTIQGFVVPEIPLGALSTIATMLGALYTKKRLEKA